MFQDAKAADGASQSVGTTGVFSQFPPQGAPSVSRPNLTVLPTQKRAESAVDSLLFSSPDSLERCIVLSDLSDALSPVTNSSCRTPPRIDSVTPLTEIGSCSSPAQNVITDVQDTPLSVRSVRKRKHRKRKLRRSALPHSPLVEPVVNSHSRGTVVRHTEGSLSDFAVKAEPKMPKLLPEPHVRYNPDTPLRISIHLPLNGVINAAEDGLLGENVKRSTAKHSFGDDVPMCSAGSSTAADSAMPVDLTSRASVQMPLLCSTSLDADMKHHVGNVSSSLPSNGPVYSPVSSISDPSTPDNQHENIGNYRQEMAQLSVGHLASFFNQFSGLPPESLQFSPSRSFWTHSFAEQLAGFNRNSFMAGHGLAAPVLSPVTANDRHMVEINRQRNDDDLFHSSLISAPESVANDRHNAEPRDCVAVKPTIVVNLDVSNGQKHSNYSANTRKPLPLCNGEAHSSTDAVSSTDILGSQADVLPGMVCCQILLFRLAYTCKHEIMTL